MMGQEGGDNWRRYTKSGDAENLDVLTCGPLPPKPVELFGADRFSDLIERVKREYSWVIIDSPPVASLADTLVLATLAEMTVFVIQHKKNDRDLIRRSVEQLRNVKANILGAVLNAVDLKHVNYGDYYYASYTYTQENESKESVRSGTDQG
jgi:capsular exopolysaccharide synthesis family protein